jgi:AraC-like DNA-binding protein
MFHDLLLVGASISFLLAAHLTVNRHGIGNRQLLFYVLIIFYLLMKEWGKASQNLAFLDYLRPLVFLLPYFMWAYIRSSAGKTISGKTRLAVCVYLGLISIIDFYFIRYLGMSELFLVMDFVAVISPLIFCYLGYFEIAGIEREFSQVTAVSGERRISWLKTFVLANLVLTTSFVVGEILSFQGFSVGNPGLYLLVVVLFWFFLITARHPSLFSQSEVEGLIRVRESAPQNPLSDERVLEIRSCLQVLLQANSIFLDPELDLSGFSKKLGFGSKEVSQYFNSVEGRSFSEFINAKRMDYALEQLKKTGSEKSVLEIAFESGFNSKASFYRQFKKQHKMSPSEFLQSLGR